MPLLASARAPRTTAAIVTLLALATGGALAGGCRDGASDARTVVTISGSTVGTEGALLARQAERFMRLHPGIRVRVQRTPDDATQRHQLYVQWLNAHVGDPDVLQLDVVWTPEFAAAGWLLPLDRFAPAVGDFFPATIEANRWAGTLYGLPWFVDVGLLYWRTDLLPHEPRSPAEMVALAQGAMRHDGAVRHGIVWQGARYEGLVTVFVEYLAAFGGRITDDGGRAVVDSPEAVRALAFMRDQIHRSGVAPVDVLTWHEEEVRFAFQNGTAAIMRNWPYAVAPLGDTAASRVAGRFAVAPMPAAPGGQAAAALGGAQLAVNAHTDVPDAAWALVAFLTAPAQMLERAAVVGQYPPRRALYDDPRLAAALNVPLAQVRRAVESAVPRPVTPVYTQLSEILQIALHRALTRQAEPAEALGRAAREMNALLEESGVLEVTARARAPRPPPPARRGGR